MRNAFSLAFPLVLLLAAAACAVDASVVLARQAESAFPDTAEIRMKTSLSLPGMPAQSVDTWLLTKGKDKSITETRSPLFSMKLVRNGNKMSMTDLKTGKTLPAQDLPQAQSSAPDVASGLGSAADYLAPVKEGGLWRLSPQDASKPTLYYSDTQKRVVKMVQNVGSGGTSETTISYCDKSCSLPGTPREFQITASQNGASTQVTIQIVSAKRVPAPPDALFDVK
jgi:hypothetical protein